MIEQEISVMLFFFNYYIKTLLYDLQQSYKQGCMLFHTCFNAEALKSVTYCVICLENIAINKAIKGKSKLLLFSVDHLFIINYCI